MRERRKDVKYIVRLETSTLWQLKTMETIADKERVIGRII